MLDDLPGLLAERLRHPLPGRAAQCRIEPEGSEGRHYSPRPSARAAAVLVLLYPHDDAWHLPLTVRPESLPHPGQISLPGGAVEVDETSQAAALRELEEELGVPNRGIELVGQLTPLYVFVSDYLVSPWVAVTRERPRWKPNPDEVAEVLEVPLSQLLDDASYTSHLRLIAGEQRTVPHIAWHSHRIWGATGMILCELAALVNEIVSR